MNPLVGVEGAHRQGADLGAYLEGADDLDMKRFGYSVESVFAYMGRTRQAQLEKASGDDQTNSSSLAMRAIVARWPVSVRSPMPDNAE